MSDYLPPDDDAFEGEIRRSPPWKHAVVELIDSGGTLRATASSGFA